MELLSQTIKRPSERGDTMDEQSRDLSLDDDDSNVKKKKEIEYLLEQRNERQSEETIHENNEEEMHEDIEEENFENVEVESRGNDGGTSGEEEEEDENYDLSLLIEQNHLELVNSIDLQRQLLFSYLRSKLIMDEEDCERIMNTGTTRQQKASIFLDVIKRKGPRGMKHFIDALQFEHPDLYKKLTGKEPASKVSTIPYMMNTSDLTGKDYIDFDRMVLAKQLEQTVGELHWVTRIHKKVQEEKNILEKKLFESEKNAKVQQQHIDELKLAIEKFSEIKRSLEEEELTSYELQSQYQRDIAVQQEVISKTYHIMALQGKLLAQNEELEYYKKESESMRDRNEHLNKQVMNISVKFNEEKRNSRRLNEQVMTHSSTCKSEKQDLREYKLQLSISKEESDRLRDENQQLKKDLNELTKFSEVLNVKFNMMSHEKNKLKEQSEEVTFSFQDAKDQIHELSCKYNSSQIDKKYLQQRSDRLQSDISRYREMQKTHLDELDHARSECQKAWKNMEEARDETMKVKKMHDETMHSQLIINRQLEEKYNDIVEQLDLMRECLEQTKDEVIHSQKTIHQLKQALQNEQTLANEKKDASGKNIDDEEDTPLSHRSRKELLESLKRKTVQKDTDMIQYTDESNIPPVYRLTFDQIRLAFPDLRPNLGSQTLPSPTKKSGFSSLNEGGQSYDKPSKTLPSPLKTKNFAAFGARSHSIESYSSSGLGSTSNEDILKRKTFSEARNSTSPSQRKGSSQSPPKCSYTSQMSLQERRKTLQSPQYYSEGDLDAPCISLPADMEELRKQGAPFLQELNLQKCHERQLSDDSSIFTDNGSVTTTNIGDVYVSTTIKQSPEMDYPPSKIHSIRSIPTGKNRRSASTPIMVDRCNPLEPTNVFVYRDGDEDGPDGDIEGGNFRKRSRNNVDAGEKSKWQIEKERRRSSSCPSVNKYILNERSKSVIEI